MKNLIYTHNHLLNKLEELKKSDNYYVRKFNKDFVLNHRIVGIVGPRGVGKTTFLLDYIQKNYNNSNKALYVSADNIYFTENPLYYLTKDHYLQYGTELLCIDEIHRYPNWNQELKNIYDSFPDINVIFSGSSSIDLIKGKYDLSRRVFLKNMHGFSFREYLEIKLKRILPTLNLDCIFDKEQQIDSEILNIKGIYGYFNDYLRSGYYASNLNATDPQVVIQTINSTIDKTIFQDISSFYKIKSNNLETLRKIMYLFATSSPGGLSINKIAGQLGHDNSTIEDYIQYLKDTQLLRFLLNDKLGYSLVRNAEKIYLDNPNLLNAINKTIGKEINIGTNRELFIVNQLENAGYKPFYTPKGDFSVDKYTIEVGGESKSGKQIKDIDNSYLVKDNLLHKTGKSIPIYLFGFLY